jgi:NADH dehydrogenase FAD-containing subunit
MGAPLVQTSSDFALESWLRFEDIPALNQSSCRILQGRVSALDVNGRFIDYKTSDGETQRLKYDYAVLASGKQRAWPVAPRANCKESFIQDSRTQTLTLSRARRIIVVGGGAVGIEMAGEIKQAWPNASVTLIHSRSSLLSSEPLPMEFKEKALSMLEESGVHVRLGCRVVGTRRMKEDEWELDLSDGEVLQCDEMLDTISRVNTDSYVPSDLLTNSGEFRATST